MSSLVHVTDAKVAFNVLLFSIQKAIESYLIGGPGYSISKIKDGLWMYDYIFTNHLMNIAAQHEGYGAAIDYHAGYCDGVEISKHGNSIWPEMPHEDEFVAHGWRNFRNCYRNGIKAIPFFTNQNVPSLFFEAADGRRPRN